MSVPTPITSLLEPLCERLRFDTTVTPALRAAVIFLARKEHLVHPAGTFASGRRFYAAASEHLPFKSIRRPSRQFPFSHMNACRRLKHVTCLLLGLPESEILPARRLAHQGWPALLALCGRELPPAVCAELGLPAVQAGSSMLAPPRRTS